MPELPDITAYVDALAQRVIGTTLLEIRARNPFVVRTAEPPLQLLEQKTVVELRRLGKRIAIGFDDSLWLIIHLMIAGRLHWNRPAAGPKNKLVLCELEFESGRLSLTEAGSKRRASIHAIQGNEALAAHNPGGLEVLEATLAEFASVIREHNHTLKRALTSPKILSGIGNSYSDEILHRAQLSPVKLTQRLGDSDVERLYTATRQVLTEWTDRLRAEARSDFPKHVTAFRDGMAVHGRFGKPCPVCGETVQRIRYSSNETNYCPRCQTGGKLLSDRSLARLLKDDWPSMIDG